MKFTKIALISIGALVLLAIAGLVVVAANVDPNKYKPELIDLVKARTGRTLKIDGPLSMSFFPRLGIAIGKVELSEAGGAKPFAKVGQVRASLAIIPLLSRQVVVDHVVVAGLTAEVVRRKDGRSNIDDLVSGGKEQQPGSSSGASAKLDIAGVDVAADSLTWADERDGTKLRLTGVKLTSGRIADNTPGKVELAARIQGDRPKLDINVSLTAGYRFAIESKAIALNGLVLKVNGDVPGAAGFKATVTGQMDANWGRQSGSGNVVMKMHDSTIKAKFDLASLSGTPAVGFDVDIDQLNLDRFKSPQGPAAAGSTPQVSAAAEKAIDLSALKSLNLNGQLRTGRVIASNVKIEKLAATIRARGGRLDINPLTAGLYGGSLAGTIGINANGNRFSVREQLSGVNIGPLLRDAINKNFIDGRGNVALDIETSGPTVAALKRALNGSAGVNLKDGAIKGINLAESFRKAKSLLGAKGSQEQGASKVDQTDFAELTASFQIRNGVAHNEDLSLKSPFLRLGGAGNIDIGKDRMDYLAKASIVSTSGGQGGKDLTDLRGLTIPVRLSGPFDALKYHIDFGTVATEAVKQQVQEKVKDQLQDRLKDLLKR